jgi:hypothetical protein
MNDRSAIPFVLPATRMQKSSEVAIARLVLEMN